MKKDQVHVVVDSKKGKDERECFFFAFFGFGLIRQMHHMQLEVLLEAHLL